MSLNKVQLIGNLGQDPELKHTQSNEPVCNFSLATSEKWTDKNNQKQERTEWHRVVVWGKQAETCSQYLSKGRQVYVEGKLQTRDYEDKDGIKRYTTEVVVSGFGGQVQFLGGGNQQDGNGPQQGRGAAPVQGRGAAPVQGRGAAPVQGRGSAPTQYQAPQTQQPSHDEFDDVPF